MQMQMQYTVIGTLLFQGIFLGYLAQNWKDMVGKSCCASLHDYLESSLDLIE
jgi:hypothetical protein